MGGSPTAREPDKVVVGRFLRKPLGPFAATLAVGVIVIAVGMKAYGASGGAASPPPPRALPAVTKAKFERAAMHICLSSRSLVEGVIARGKPRSLRAAAAEFHWMTPRFDGLTREVDGLVPPPSAAKAAVSLKRLRSKLDPFDRALDHLDHFAETRQWRRFVLLARSRGFEKLVKDFGSPRKLRNIHCGRASLDIA
jgi:hypothetical protein